MNSELITDGLKHERSSLALRFRKASLANKLRILLLLSTLLITLLVLVTTVAKDLYLIQSRLRAEAATRARIMAENIAPALLFLDKEAARATLKTLSKDPAFVSAQVLNKNGELFSAYPKSSRVLMPASGEYQSWENYTPYLYIGTPITSQGEHIGALYIKTSLKDIYRALLIDVIFAVGLFLLALLIFNRFNASAKKYIAEPLSALVKTLDSVTTTKDYSRRSPKLFQDEIGHLVDCVNRMLATVEIQTRELEESQQVLEKRVEERTRELTEQARELIAARDAAQAAVKAKSEFLANMSHEIRTPMNGIIGMTDLLLDSGLKDSQRELAETVKSSADALLTIINDILDFSKIEAGKLLLSPREFRLDTVTTDIEKLLKTKFDEKSLEYVTSIAPDVPLGLYGDDLRLRQVLINMLGNAIKFTPAGGGIVLLVEKVSATGTNTTIRFSVADSGIGIEPEKQPGIFEAFTQADSSTTRLYGGTGLGLSISSQLVKMMGGEITLESRPGVGSVFSFTVTMPTLDVRQEEEEEVTVTRDCSDPACVKILLAEDNKVNQKLFLKILDKEGYQVKLANNGQEAIELYESEDFDLILMDIQMPIVSGLEATGAIREKEKQSGRHIPIVALTANAMAGDRERFLSAGMDAYLAKPIKRQEFLEVIKSITAVGAAPGEPTQSAAR
ncbi:MAG: response regulator [Candidatus Dadabacteria bacterium]|nr:MAG: response regulator [Candidatus Dadabacteria bacterium]